MHWDLVDRGNLSALPVAPQHATGYSLMDSYGFVPFLKVSSRRLGKQRTGC